MCVRERKREYICICECMCMEIVTDRRSDERTDELTSRNNISMTMTDRDEFKRLIYVTSKFVVSAISVVLLYIC